MAASAVAGAFCEAWPGDIIGILNHRGLRIGDTLTEGEAIRITGIPSFAPEILQRVKVEDPMKTKHLRHALGQLAEEGLTRVFKPLAGGDWIIGVVGGLRLDVLTARLAAEYDLPTRLDGAPFQAARLARGRRPEPSSNASAQEPLGQPRTMTACPCSSPATPTVCTRQRGMARTSDSRKPESRTETGRPAGGGSVIDGGRLAMNGGMSDVPIIFCRTVTFR